MSEIIHKEEAYSSVLRHVTISVDKPKTCITKHALTNTLHFQPLKQKLPCFSSKE